MSALKSALRASRPIRPHFRPATEHSLSERDFNRIAGFAYREFGLHLPAPKLGHVRSRLLRLLEQLQCPDFTTLCDRLEAAPQGPLRRALISALTTNVTQFFREEHHFRLFAEALVKPRLAALRAGARLRIWSAGCSAGQEACSIAMTLLEILPDAGRLNIRILGTDIDPAVLEQARRGTYPLEEVQGIPPHIRRSMTEQEPATPTDVARLRIAPQVAGMIRFAELNLIEDWPLKGPFDAIFCRNVAIYFDKPTQSRLWERFTNLLSPEGMLLIGHSERVAGPAADRLTSAGITTYRLSAPSPAPDWS